VARYQAIEYTIIFDVAGGDAISSMTYTIESGVTLPTAVKGLYSFKGWVPVADAGNWDDGSRYDPVKYTGMYGNVTLEAQWAFELNYTVESYKYAIDDYVMLRIHTDDNTNAFHFGGQDKAVDLDMYYTNASEYALETGKGVFVTLIPVDYTDGTELNADGIALLTRTGDAATVIQRDGKINSDDVVNIADANAVYQMVQNGGSYYSLAQLDTLARLKADMATAIGDNTDDHRGSIADVNAILAVINGASPAEDTGAQNP